MEKRVYNFAAGPAVLPLPALETAQRDLLCLPGAGASVMEISHRSSTFTKIVEDAEANLRKLLDIPSNYRVLFLQGGAHLQFAMIPMNLLGKSGKSADYVLTGSWTKKALEQGRTQGTCRVAYDAKPFNYDRVPENSELDLDPNAAYVYYASNETIGGVQFPTEPEVGNVPLVCDASSDLLHKKVPIEKYGLIYACAQKNIGPAGVTLVILRDDLVAASPDGLAAMLSYKDMVGGKSLYNTPPCFGIYMVKLVTDWLLNDVGGLDKMYELNKRKAKTLYDVIDGSNGFYTSHALPSCRSVMNVTFRLPDESMEKPFVAEAAKRGLVSLGGHRSVGGFRASIYNAMPLEGVQALANFMREFQDANRK